jgi:hypothetical protein
VRVSKADSTEVDNNEGRNERSCADSYYRRCSVVGSVCDEIVALAKRLARTGFVAAAIDARYHGERTGAGSGVAEYNEAIARAWRTGEEHPFYYDTVWDVMRLVDFLATREDIDSKRIGLTGFSKGGIETYLTAAVDPRIATAVPFIGVQSFKWAAENGQWKARIATIQDAFDVAAAEAKQQNPGVDFLRAFYDRVVPGIYGEFDGPAMLPLIAPRPLLVVNSDSDANTPIAGVRLAVESARPKYAAQGAADKLVLRVQEKHRAPRDARKPRCGRGMVHALVEAITISLPNQRIATLTEAAQFFDRDPSTLCKLAIKHQIKVQ